MFLGFECLNFPLTRAEFFQQLNEAGIYRTRKLTHVSTSQTAITNHLDAAPHQLDYRAVDYFCADVQGRVQEAYGKYS